LKQQQQRRGRLAAGAALLLLSFLVTSKGKEGKDFLVRKGKDL